MKKVLFIVITITLIASPSFGKMYQQMGGRISPDSPNDFKIGKKKVHLLSEGTKVVGHLYLQKK